MEFPAKGSRTELYSKLKERLGGYVQGGKIPYIKDLDFNDGACEASASGAGFKAKISCLDNKVKVDLDLNFALKMMRGQIEDQIKKTVEKLFA